MSQISIYSNLKTLASFEMCIQEITSFIENMPTNSKWKDFYETSIGKTLIELLSGINAFLTYHCDNTRREVYLETCRYASSATLLAQALGYDTRRKLPPIISLRLRNDSEYPIQIKGQDIEIDSTTTEVDDIGELNEVGMIDKYPIVPVSDITIQPASSMTTSDKTVEVQFYIGTWVKVLVDMSKENIDEFTSIRIPSINDLDIADNIDDDYGAGSLLTIYVNDQIVPISRYQEELASDSVLIQTSFLGGIKLGFGNGSIGYRITASDKLEVNYLATPGQLSDIDKMNVKFHALLDGIKIDGTPKIIESGSTGDSVKKIKYLAPQYRVTLRRAVSRPDYEALIMSYPGIISAKATVIRKYPYERCCEIVIACLKDTIYTDRTSVLLPDEIDAILAYMEPLQMYGSIITLVDPRAIGIKPSFTIVPDKDADLNDIRMGVLRVFHADKDDVDSYKLTYTNELGKLIKIPDVINKVASIKGVKQVYCRRPWEDKQLDFDQFFQLDLKSDVDANNIVTEADLYNIDINFISSATELSNIKPDLSSTGYVEYI